MATSRHRSFTNEEFVFSVDHLAEMSDSDSAHPYTVHTLERALKVLKAFAGRAKPLSNADLVRRTGYSKASVSRITATLVSLRYLERAPDGLRFQIGLRGLTLGHNYLANGPIREIARPIMQEFAERFDVSVALAVGDELNMLYVEYCKSSRIFTLHLEVGSLLPMELTSIGRAYLWALPPDARQRLLFQIVKQAGPQGPFIIASIESAFNHLDKYGHCIAVGEYRRDSYGVSVPLFLGSPPVPMGLNCGAVISEPLDASIHEVLVPNMHRMASALTAALSQVDSTLF
jgi:DNA-binding IclR family transcriptional regulator